MKKYQCLLFSAFLGAVFAAVAGHAQEDHVATAASSLQAVLANLKESIEKLSFDNEQWMTRNEQVKAQVAQLQAQLAHLKDRTEELNKAVHPLQAPNGRRSEQIKRLQEENADLDKHIQSTSDDIQSIQQRSKTSIFSQKDKLKLMTMIYDSQQRQEELYRSIGEVRKNAQASRAAVPRATGADRWNEAQLAQLEAELKTLEQNYSSFKDLTKEMGRKAKALRLAAPKQSEVEKLQISMDDLNRQHAQLKGDLNDLRAQMIELDKRKSYLELMTSKQK